VAAASTRPSERNAIIARCALARDQPVGGIERHLLRIALGSLAEAAAARQFEADKIAAGHALPALRADRPARDQGDPAGGAGAAAVAAAGRVDRGQ
jgi:hypothetical protein